MDPADIYLQIPLTPIHPNQMRPFSKLIPSSDLLASSLDGRVFQISYNDYRIKRSLSLHTSWVTTISTSDKFFCSGSYDSTIKFTTISDLFSYNSDPRFLTLYLHKDYVYSTYIMDNYLISCSSEPVNIISEIGQASVDPIHTIKYSNTAHASVGYDSIVFFGHNNGVLNQFDTRSGELIQRHTNDQCIKCLAINKNLIAIGYLDGNTEIIDMNSFSVHSKYQCNGRVVSIVNQSDGFLLFSANGTIIDTSSDGFGKVDTDQSILSGCVTKNMHIGLQDGTLIQMNSDKIELKELSPSTYFTRANRLPQSTDILCKDSNHQVSLWGLDNFEVKETFGRISYKEKLKELSKKPYFYFPVTLDLTSGAIRVTIPPMLPKLIDPSMKSQRETIRSVLQTISDLKKPIITTDSQNRMIWQSTADLYLPQWTRYLMLAKYQ